VGSTIAAPGSADACAREWCTRRRPGFAQGDL